LEVRDDLLAEKAKSVEHLLVPRRPDGAEQNGLLDPQTLVEFEKPDAVRRRADAELCALLAHLLRSRLTRMRAAGQTPVALVIALVVLRHGGWIIVAPHQAGALALLLDVPAHQLGAALGDNPRILMAIAGRHQRSARGGSSAGGRPAQCISIERHQLLDALRA